MRCRPIEVELTKPFNGIINDFIQFIIAIPTMKTQNENKKTKYKNVESEFDTVD